MKKIIGIAMVALMAVSAVQADEAAEEVGNIGVGYQGLIPGNLLNGVAIRMKPAPIGGQVELMQGIVDQEGNDADLIIIKGKGYYALVERPNSTLYAGASLGIWRADAEGNDLEGISIAPLFGVEWNFAELPEIGLNFEVSYEMNFFDAEGNDLELFGINVSTGVIYYF